MKSIKEKLEIIEKHISDGKIKIMIIGLGSVGSYLLDYLVSKNDPAIEVIVVGRNEEKLRSKVNIVRVAGLIRGVNKSHIYVESNVDLDNVGDIQRAIEKYNPDFIVNSSRAYTGLKYGSISWNNIRAYGIWTPLSIRYTKNIMEAYNLSGSDALVINTSYSDAVIPWLKTAGKAYPDFGSGNLNHLIPRMKFAVAELLGVDDFWNVDMVFAAGHFHDVCISKEGQTEGVDLPLKIYYKGEEQELPHEKVYAACKIAMPVDQTRNMMNASSNYSIITAVIDAVRTKESQRVFVPGFDGNLGGYPVLIGYRDGKIDAWIDESVFNFAEMNAANRQSMALDGVEDVVDGKLIYTDGLLEKVRSAFNVELPKTVAFDDIDETAKYIVEKIILPQTEKK